MATVIENLDSTESGRPVEPSTETAEGLNELERMALMSGRDGDEPRHFRAFERSVLPEPHDHHHDPGSLGLL